MRLLLDLNELSGSYFLQEDKQVIAQGREDGVAGFKKLLERLKASHSIGCVGYILRAGQPLDGPVVEWVGESIEDVHGVLGCSLFVNSFVKEVLSFSKRSFVESRHFILNDASFFSSMPSYAKNYALPFVYIEEGFTKRGSHGFVYEWALKQLAQIKGHLPRKVVAVFLNDQTDVVALKDGQPVASSHGLSCLDGMLSRTGCGAIDVSVIIQMSREGSSWEEIWGALSQESGFKALAGEDVSLSDLLLQERDEFHLAQEVFAYQLLKNIGACWAAIDGADALVFVGEKNQEMYQWTYHFLKQLEFLGFQRENNSLQEGIAMVSLKGPIEVYYVGCEKYSVMADFLPV